MEDVTRPQQLEVKFRDDYKVLWINVDGQCAFRACFPARILIDLPGFHKEIPERKDQETC